MTSHSAEKRGIPDGRDSRAPGALILGAAVALGLIWLARDVRRYSAEPRSGPDIQPTAPQMTEAEKINATALANSSQKSLEQLFDYTKFHIHLYLLLTGAYLTAASAHIEKRPLLELNKLFIPPAVLFTMIAGLAAGVIASSLTQWVGGSSKDFLRTKIGPWDLKCLRFKALKWTYLEHTSFWIGLSCAVLSFVPEEKWCVVGRLLRSVVN